MFSIVYISKKLLPHERNYSIMENKCLAIVWAVNKLKQYLFGKEFILQTDHQSLSFLQKAKFSNASVMRWALSLQPYKFVVEYVKGYSNHGADYLSRLE